MAFLDAGIIMVRSLINDWDSPQTYDENRLRMALLVGAQFVNNEFSMQHNYVINFNTMSISPDPVPNDDTTGADGWMLNLSSLKTSIMMLRNDLKIASLSAWSIRDSDVNIDLRNMAQFKKTLLDDLLKMWEIDRAQYAVGVSPSCAAILTPINIYGSMGHGQSNYSYSLRNQVVY